MPSKFSDVAVGEWYTGAINLATDIGVIAGFPDGTFRPNDNITVAQAVTLMVNALGRGVYVKEAGQWPANYITEAAELGITKDIATGSQQDDLANRGMVAAMAWKTLGVATWRVGETDNKGGIISGEEETMLELYFKDYATELGYAKWFEDVEILDTYITNKEIASNQVIVSVEDIAGQLRYGDALDIKTENRTKNKEEKSYLVGNSVEDATEIVIYIADEDVKAIDLQNKKVDMFLGKDNKAVFVVVREDAEVDLLTKYLAEDDQIVVGSEKYKLAKKDIKITLNNVLVDEDASLAQAKDVIEAVIKAVTGKEADNKTITKAIKVNIGLESDKVTKLALEVSGNFTFEDIVVEEKDSEGEITEASDLVVTQFIVKEIKKQ